MSDAKSNSDSKPSDSQTDEVLREWRESAFYWQKHAGTIRIMFGPITQALIEDAGLIKGDTVLDVACGAGEPSLTIAEVVGPTGSVTCTDVVPEMVAAADSRAALSKTSDEHLMTSWRLLARGQVVVEEPRHVMIQDTINHWAHHRGQMTVYLRLMGAKVPALYGPSADDNRF